MKYEYPALQTQQTNSNKMVVMFAAPANEVDRWVGVPQKKQFGTNEESVGFQREENAKRVSSLGEFCGNEQNIIQNPLLCATRQSEIASVQFVAKGPMQNSSQVGSIVIEVPDYNDFSMEKILRMVREYLENRVPECKTLTPDGVLVARLKGMAAEMGHLASAPAAGASDEEPDPSEEGEPAEVAEAESALFEESHILDFWQEVAARHEVIKLIENDPPHHEFLGFTRQALLSYLRPVVLVDGQHRLRGAIHAAHDLLDKKEFQEEIENRIASGETPEQVQEDLIKRNIRNLPVSLLVSDDPAEQVFQFVVVNQKATPIGRALLGTIVSTTLSNSEMENVASRLKHAGIELEESQAITYLARFPGSPFFNLVERGLAGDSKDLLQWGVFSSLVTIFRDLKGGKLFGFKNDYAEAWKGRFLDQSAIVQNYQAAGYATPIAYWQSLDGPWRDVFIAFFIAIRDKFGSLDVEGSHNFWGQTRSSNLFNKISLTILTADFFQFLVETKQSIDSAAVIKDLADSWLDGVSASYFNRDWNLAGTKKDSSGIRDQWAYQWVEYRKNPTQLPQARLYRVPKGG